MIDVESMEDTNLVALYEAAQAEVKRRAEERAAAQAVVDAKRKATEVRRATLPPDWQAWRQPAGVHDAYGFEQIVAHNGRFWQSDHEANVWEPGTVPGLWHEVEDTRVSEAELAAEFEDANRPPTPGPDSDPDSDDGEVVPAWGPGLHVQTGDHYMYGGAIYAVVQAHTTQDGWEPPKVPALWNLISTPPDEPGVPSIPSTQE